MIIDAIKVNVPNDIKKPFPPKKDNAVTFCGNGERKKLPPAHLKTSFIPYYQKEYLSFVENSSTLGKNFAKKAHNIARKYPIYKDGTKTALITYDHFYLTYLKELYDYAKEVKNGVSSFATVTHTTIPGFTSQYTGTDFWNKDNMDNALKLIREEGLKVTQELREKSTPDGFVSSLEIEKGMMDDIHDFLANDYGQDKEGARGEGANDSYIPSVLVDSSNRKKAHQIRDFHHALATSYSLKKEDSKDVVLPFYSSTASKTIKNLDRNHNIIVTYSEEDKKAPQYFIANVVEQLKNRDKSEEFKTIKEENTKIAVFNDKINLPILAGEIDRYAKDPDHEYIVILEDTYKNIANSFIATEGGGVGLDLSSLDRTFGTTAKNIHYVYLMDRTQQYNINSTIPAVKERLSDFQTLQLPIMDSKSTKEQAFESKEYIESEIGMKLDDEALEYACSLPFKKNNSRYEKILRFLKRAASYNIDQEKLTKEQVEYYYENFKKDDNAQEESSYDIIFDTKMDLDSLIGSKMVKTQAENAAYEIKNFPQTRGYVVYNADGSSSGRLECAKAIAGEVGIPMITINAADFAIRDFDSLSYDPMKAIEQKMGKLFDLMKTQAQANDDKTVMLYIDNFDSFASNPMYGLSSVYEKQAFNKLVREMQKAASDNSYNIVVMGSTDYPEAIDDKIVRPGLFMDSIGIYSASVPQNVKDMALKHIEEKGYKIDGSKEEFLDHISKLARGAEYIDIVDLLDKANIIAHRNSKDGLSIEFLNQTYLERVYGQVSEIDMSERRKESTIRHEGGHAVTLQFMFNLLKEQGDDLRISNEITNITLDPRGNFLGCVMDRASEENTTTSNLETVFSDIVCCFGGNSAEEHFYNMQGSWGITQDMSMANSSARRAVLYMGLGANSGHFIPAVDYNTGAPIFSTSEEAKNFDNDVKAILENAKIISDKIVKCYEDFLVEFSDENIDKFGTGKCVITGVDFAKSLKDWEAKQSPQKKAEIYKLKKEAKAIIECTRDGKKYSGLNKLNPKYRRA